MPIYAYRCESCGFEKDVLRKLSDPPLSDCPNCGKPTFQKQVTAAGFQLKGSGWYVTDFRNNGSKPGGSPEAAGTSVPAAGTAAGATKSTDSGGTPAASTSAGSGSDSAGSSSAGGSGGSTAAPAPASSGNAGASGNTSGSAS